jgi:nitrogen fixation NifU-like protein
MTDDLTELYQEVILDHTKRPRNRRAIASPNRTAEGYNPLCGDHIHVYLRMHDGRIDDASFTGSACAICTASASMLTEAVTGRSADEARVMFDRFRQVLTERDAVPDDDLGELAALAGVRRFPIRVKCATLPWHTLKAALEGAAEPVSTEPTD